MARDDDRAVLAAIEVVRADARRLDLAERDAAAAFLDAVQACPPAREAHARWMTARARFNAAQARLDALLAARADRAKGGTVAPERPSLRLVPGGRARRALPSPRGSRGRSCMVAPKAPVMSCGCAPRITWVHFIF